MHWLASERLPGELRSAVQKVIQAFGNFFHRPLSAVEVVKDRIEQVSNLDPGPGQPERRDWARVLGTLEEINFHLAHHPGLSISRSYADADRD